MTENLELPSFSELISESWELFKKKFGSVLVITIVGFLLQLLTVVVFAGIVIALIVVTEKTNFGSLNFSSLQNVKTGSRIVAGLFLALFILILAGISFVTYIARLMILEGKKEKISFYVKSSLSMILPFIGTGLMIAFLGVGSFFFFIVPSIILSFFCIFVPYVIVFEKLSYVAALKRSTQLVVSNFGNLFIKILVLVFVPILVQAVLLSSAPQSFTSQVIMQGPLFIFDMLWNFFFYIYIYVLYKNSVRTVKVESSSALKWLIVCSVIGYIFLALTVFSIVTFVQSRAGKQMAQEISNGIEEGSKKADTVDTSMSSLPVAETPTTPLTPEQAAVLANQTFTFVNKKRADLGIKPITEASSLCKYAQRRVDIAQNSGEYDNGAGFNADLKNPKLAGLYFITGTMFQENFHLVDSDVTAAEIGEGWINYAAANPSTTSPLDKKVDKGCVVSGSKILFMISSANVKIPLN